MTNALGVDVSIYQTTTPPLTGLSFLFARASIGLGTDPKYAMHIRNAKAAGLVTGAYHFAYTGRIEDQADLFVRAAGDVDFLFIDVEGREQPTVAEVRRFIDTVHAKGKSCGLYHSESGYFSAGQDYDWVANWTRLPSRGWDWHQYRGGPLDLDRFNGTAAELRAFASVPQAPDSSVEAPVPGVQFRFLEDLTGSVTVVGTGQHLIRVDTQAYVDVPAGQVRVCYGKVELTAPLNSGVGLGSQHWLVGNVVGLSPDESIAALLPLADGAYKAGPNPLADDLALAQKQAAGYKSRLVKINGLSAV